MEYELKKSNKKQKFSTGAQRDTQDGKSRPDLISPIFLDRLGVLLAKGAEHYGERNWEKGIPLSRLLSSAFRHLIQTLDGMDDEDHAIQCAFNLMAYVHIKHCIMYGSLPAELHDIPRKKNLQANLTSSKNLPTIKQNGDDDGLIRSFTGGSESGRLLLMCTFCAFDFDVYFRHLSGMSQVHCPRCKNEVPV